MPRMSPPDGARKRVMVHLDRRQIAALHALAEDRGSDMATLIRSALDAMLLRSRAPTTPADADVLRLRMPRALLDIIRECARREGVTVSEYVREAARRATVETATASASTGRLDDALRGGR